MKLSEAISIMEAAPNPVFTHPEGQSIRLGEAGDLVVVGLSFLPTEGWTRQLTIEQALAEAQERAAAAEFALLTIKAQVRRVLFIEGVNDARPVVGGVDAAFSHPEFYESEGNHHSAAAIRFLEELCK